MQYVGLVEVAQAASGTVAATPHSRVMTWRTVRAA